MKVKNTSKKTFNLASGECKPGVTAEVDSKEFSFLVSQGLVEVVSKEPAKPAPVKPAEKDKE